MANKASEEITYFLDHLKKTSFYFSLLLWRLFRILGNLLLSMFYLAFTALLIVFINLLRVIVLALISLYFLLKFLNPAKKKKDPFANTKGYQKLIFLNEIGKSSKFLCLGLDETLFYCSQSRPADKAYEKFKFAALDQPEKSFYLQKRPYLEEFLEEVA